MSITAQDLADMLAGEHTLKVTALAVPFSVRLPVTAAAAVNAVAQRAKITKTLAMSELIMAGWEATIIAAPDHVSDEMTKLYGKLGGELTKEAGEAEEC